MKARADIKLYGVIGWPVAHSLSPRIHHYWYEQYNLNADYSLLPVLPEDFTQALKSLPAKGFHGFNLTVPHKEKALALMDRLDASAEKTRAVNTVLVKDGALHGFNTDAYGFAESTRQGLPSGYVFQNKTATILGAGGAARAVAVALYEALGFRHIRIVNRSRERADDLKRSLEVSLGITPEIFGWNDLETALSETAFLVNTTTLGMEGQPELSIDLSCLPPFTVVSDIVYKPRKTALLKQAEMLGLHTIGGIGMLVHQAACAFTHWFGIVPVVDDAFYAMLERA